MYFLSAAIVFCAVSFSAAAAAAALGNANPSGSPNTLKEEKRIVNIPLSFPFVDFFVVLSI